jgi:hypothetical protein
MLLEPVSEYRVSGYKQHGSGRDWDSALNPDHDRDTENHLFCILSTFSLEFSIYFDCATTLAKSGS